MTTRIVCLGGGYTALWLTRSLRQAIRRGRIDLTIVCRDNFHTFHGFVHEMLVGKIQAAQIISAARRVFRPANFHNAEIESIDLAGRTVTTSRKLDGRQYVLPFDHLVIAVGSTDDLSRYAGIAEHALSLKAYWDCFRARNQIISMLEMAEIEQDPVERRRLLTFVVAGGNFGGVEVATELKWYLQSLAGREYVRIHADEIRVIIVHSLDRILPELLRHHEPLVAWAERYVAQSGIDIRLNTKVAAATAEEVILSTGERIPTRTIISCTGTSQSPLLDTLDLQRDERGRAQTDEFLRVPGHSNLWAGGDCAAVPHPKGGTCPPLGIFALTHGRQIARNIMRTLEGRSLEKYQFIGLGDGCSLGHRRAVAHLKGVRMTGLVAWLAWRLILLHFIPAFDRKVRLVLDWIVWPLIGRDVVNMKVEQPMAVQKEHFEPGQDIVRQGDTGRRLYVIWKGEVDVLKDGPSGQEEIARLGSGQHFGEIAVFNDVRRTATVRARTPVDLISIGRTEALAFGNAIDSLGKTMRQLPTSRTKDAGAVDEQIRSSTTAPPIQ